ncbi:GntR family transcriptional regulator [Butyrivibrio sp. AE3006]|uniref:GntR family transcriptional regulator n=1 Tax=Butyrivibrio sp. AE3006 TaxID=1280673 RepID=UPI00041A8C28|nr:GntR family transcriptional regulator [Butyrivibrio sp. AE3006]
MERIKKIPPHDRAVEQIIWYIEENNLKPHAKLPGERELCEMWNLNRSTLHQAIQQLIKEKILYSEKGSGTFVAEPVLERNLNDGTSTSESMRKMGYFLWTEVLLSRVEECSEYVSHKLGIPEGSKVFHLERLRLRNNTPLMIETSYMEYSRCQGIEEHDFSEESLYHLLEEYGNKLGAGEEWISITTATDEEAKKLHVNPGQQMYYLTGFINDINDKPVEYFKIVAKPDQVRFSTGLTREASE